MPPDKVATARQMYDSKQYTVEAIAGVLGVSRASIYRHLADAGPGPAPEGGGAGAEAVLVARASRKQRPGGARRG